MALPSSGHLSPSWDGNQQPPATQQEAGIKDGWILFSYIFPMVRALLGRVPPAGGAPDNHLCGLLCREPHLISAWSRIPVHVRNSSHYFNRRLASRFKTFPCCVSSKCPKLFFILIILMHEFCSFNPESIQTRCLRPL